MSNLPDELVRIIFGYDADIRPFVLLNKHYNHIATPILYESVAFRDLPLLQAFNHTLTKRPTLCAHVTTLRLTFSSSKATYTNLIPREIKHLLMLVPALTNLTLSLDEHISKFLFERPHYPFLLCTFCVEPLDSDDFVGFLETQPHIETLHFKTDAGQGRRMPGIIPMLGRHVLPNLKEIETIPTTIMNLVPSRPISRVKVDRSWDHSLGMYDTIRRSSAPLTQFCEYIKLQKGTWDTEIVRLLERLEHSKESLKELMIWVVSNRHSTILSMEPILPLEDHSALSGRSKNLQNQLSKFHNLRRFQLEYLHGPIITSEFCITFPELERFDRWEELCPLLEEVTVFGVRITKL